MRRVALPDRGHPRGRPPWRAGLRRRHSGLDAALLPLFRDGKALLLVDGLDEIHDEPTRATFVGHLESFLGDHGKCRFVATSREAGFALVAPTISQFCERFRVAPLSEDAITTLCAHWHTLMAGDSPESRQESADISKQLTTNESLRGLAENPLLLTMLLVVKQGYGRLPPDRVSLYERAVEVLLDTWNIKAHARLNPREAIPQLAYVAYEMMRAGKQTATEDELLHLIESARANVPQIRLYAKDTPLDFLGRVELRSSLIVEAGRQAEGIGTVPVYQFRHLTFQEYLAAVAAAEGHYAGHTGSDTVLKPLEPYLTADEWKEVIPMAAVLAKTQADPLLQALLSAVGEPLPPASGLKRLFEGVVRRIPPAVDRLMQCLIEEAQVLSPDIRTAALQAILLANAPSFDPLHFGLPRLAAMRSLAALCHGPYGDELRRQAWRIFSCLDREPRGMTDLVSFVMYQALPDSLLTPAGQSAHEMLLRSQDSSVVGPALLALLETRPVGLDAFRVRFMPGPAQPHAFLESITLAETHLFHETASVRCAAALVLQRFASTRTPEPAVRTQLVNCWLTGPTTALNWAAASALAASMSWPRESWTPALTDEQAHTIARQADLDPPLRDAALTTAYHSRSVFTDEQLIARLQRIETPADKHKDMLRALGLSVSKPSRRTRRIRNVTRGPRSG